VSNGPDVHTIMTWLGSKLQQSLLWCSVALEKIPVQESQNGKQTWKKTQEGSESVTTD